MHVNSSGEIECKIEDSYLEAGGTVEELNYMSNTGFGGLRKSRFKSLDHKEDQNLPRKSGSVFQGQQHQL